jgi:tRNA-dihydrouridine synthase 3
MEVYVDTAADKERPEKRIVFFVGNGDCYSHIDYFNAVDNAKVDSVMLARGALIKPWIFEEIQSGQYLDKSASERLDLVQDYCRYGLECWGSDELGVATTRRFLLEWLSFTCRLLFLWALWSFGTDRGADMFLLEYWRGSLQRSMTGHRSGRVEMRWRLC